MSALVGQTLRPVKCQAERVGKRFQRVLRRLSNQDNHIDQRQGHGRHMFGMHGYQNRLSEPVRQCFTDMAPVEWQHVMRLVEDDPMRAAGSSPHRLQAWEKMPEVLRSVGERYSQQIEIEIQLGILKNAQALHSRGSA